MLEFYNDIQGGRYNGNSAVMSVDSLGCQSITLVNTSLAGSIFILPSNIDLQPGQSFVFTGKDFEINKGKIEFLLTNFFANIEYGYALIMKKNINAGI